MPLPDGGAPYFQSIPGDPAALRQAAARIGSLCSQLGAHGSAVSKDAGQVAGSGWSGSAADRFDGLSHRLAAVHREVDHCLGTLPAALSSFAAALESAQQQLARAEQMMREAQDDYSSALAGLPGLPAGADAAETQQHQNAISSISDSFDQRSRAASHLADTAVTDTKAAAARLTSHVARVADEAHGVQGTLTQIGDSLGVPVAVLSALSTVAILRAAGRLATVGSAFSATATQEGDQLARFLGRALAHGDISADEAVARIVQFVDHRELAAQVFANEAKADVAAGGLLNLGRFTDAAKWAGRGAGVLAIVGDIYTFWHPDQGGTMGNVERGVAVANGVGTGGLLAVDGLGLAEAGGVLAADTALGWVPVAGQVLVVGSGLYLMGDYLYTHTKWFHDTVDAVGDGLADAGKAVAHGATTVVDDIGSGLSDAGHGLASAASSVAGFFGL